jgi:hypothetical protein
MLVMCTDSWSGPRPQKAVRDVMYVCELIRLKRLRQLYVTTDIFEAVAGVRCGSFAE